MKLLDSFNITHYFFLWNSNKQKAKHNFSRGSLKYGFRPYRKEMVFSVNLCGSGTGIIKWKFSPMINKTSLNSIHFDKKRKK